MTLDTSFYIIFRILKIGDVMATGKASGKKKGECPKSGCIKKVGSNWRVVSNKTGKLWPAKYKSRDSAKKALAAYHMH